MILPKPAAFRVKTGKMWKDSIRNIVVIFQPNILRSVGFYVRHSATVFKILDFKQMGRSPHFRCGTCRYLWLEVEIDT